MQCTALQIAETKHRKNKDKFYYENNTHTHMNRAKQRSNPKMNGWQKPKTSRKFDINFGKPKKETMNSQKNSVFNVILFFHRYAVEVFTWFSQNVWFTYKIPDDFPFYFRSLYRFCALKMNFEEKKKKKEIKFSNKHWTKYLYWSTFMPV